VSETQLVLFDWPPPRKEVHLELFPPTHEGVNSKRKTCVDERIYADEWKRLNKPAREDHYTLLERILTPENAAYVSYISDRDSIVAATVVQYMATHWGSNFLHECEQKIAEAKEIRKPFQHRDLFYGRVCQEPYTTIAKQIKEIVSAHLTPDSYECGQLQNEILNFVVSILCRGFPPTVTKATKSRRGRIIIRDETPPPDPTVMTDVQTAIDTINQELEEKW
jgi:hypothetical protein